MLSVYGLTRVQSVDQLFIERDASGKIVLLVGKLTDDFLLVRTREALECFTEALKALFTI